MQIPKSDLPHTANLKRRTAGAKDSYGNPSYTEATDDVPCFFDTPKDEIIVRFMDEDIKAEGILFVHPDSVIELNDRVSSVDDANGNSITSKELRVAKISPAADETEVHHLEIYLVNHG